VVNKAYQKTHQWCTQNFILGYKLS